MSREANIVYAQSKSMSDTMREKFDAWYASPHGEIQFTAGTHYLGWAYVCYAEGYKQAALDLGKCACPDTMPVDCGCPCHKQPPSASNEL